MEKLYIHKKIVRISSSNTFKGSYIYSSRYGSCFITHNETKNELLHNIL